MLSLIPSKAQTSNKNSSIDYDILHNCQDEDCDPDDDNDDDDDEDDDDDDDVDDEEEEENDEDDDDNSGGDDGRRRKNGQIEREHNYTL